MGILNSIACADASLLLLNPIRESINARLARRNNFTQNCMQDVQMFTREIALSHLPTTCFTPRNYDSCRRASDPDLWRRLFRLQRPRRRPHDLRERRAHLQPVRQEVALAHHHGQARREQPRGNRRARLRRVRGRQQNQVGSF